MEISKIEKKLARKIRHKLRKIENGYKVFDCYIDDYDDYGPIIHYECNNGISGESWYIKDSKYRYICLVKNKIINDGIYYNNKKYYIDCDLFIKNYEDKDLVKIISEEEHNNYMKTKKIIQNILQKMNICKKNNRYESYINYFINIAPLHSIENLKKCFFEKNLNHNNSNLELFKMFKTKPFRNEKVLLGL